MISTPFSDEDDEESRPFSRDQRIVGVGSPTPSHSNNASLPSITLRVLGVTEITGTLPPVVKKMINNYARNKRRSEGSLYSETCIKRDTILSGHPLLSGQ